MWTFAGLTVVSVLISDGGVTVEFFGMFDEGIEFAFAGFIGGHIVVAHWHELLYFLAFSGDYN